MLEYFTIFPDNKESEFTVFIKILSMDEVLIFSVKFIFHFEISGIIKSELHCLKILFILILLKIN